MSSPEHQGTPATKPEAVEEVHAIPDPFLAAMAAYATREESFELSLILHVSGMVVSGIMVSPAAFFDHLGNWLAERGAGEFAESFTQPVAQMFRDAADQQAATDDDDDLPTTVDFIHLRDARVFTSGSAEPLPAAPWRGRLAHVSGWSIGTLGAGERG